MDLEGKTALVLGAIKGIGREIGLALAGRGVRLGLTWYDWKEHLSDMKAAFADIQLDSAKVIGVETDALWPPHQQKEICEMFSSHGVNCHLEMLPSIQGHDSFLVDYDRFCPIIRDYFKKIE